MDLFTRLKHLKHYRRQIIDRHAAKQLYENGIVIAEVMTPNKITLEERGQLSDRRYQNNTYNYYRWQLTTASQLQLSHLHYQKNKCLLLASFDLRCNNMVLKSAPFRCGKDCYQAQLTYSEDHITLVWSIKGLKKSSCIRSNYY